MAKNNRVLQDEPKQKKNSSTVSSIVSADLIIFHGIVIEMRPIIPEKSDIYVERERDFCM